MNSSTCRADQMDAQRFDPSKLWMSSHLTAATRATTDNTEDREDNFRLSSPTQMTVTAPLEDLSIVSAIEDCNMGVSSYLSYNPSELTLIPSCPDMFVQAKSQSVTDISKHDGNTIICRVDTPKKRPSFLNFFSRSSSPVQLPRRPSSPSLFKLSSLNCFNSTDGLQDDLVHTKGRDDGCIISNGQPTIEVRVIQERTIYSEEKWRAPLQELLYGQNYRMRNRIAYSS